MTARPAAIRLADDAGIRILDGLVVVAGEPFTDVILRESHFRRWSDREIAAYHRATRQHARWGWLPRRARRWLRLPTSRPVDRTRMVVGCVIENGARSHH